MCSRLLGVVALQSAAYTSTRAADLEMFVRAINVMTCA
jgi:hypothetical protein